MLRTGRNRTPGARLREPQSLDVFLCQRHGRIEADNREVARHMQDGLDDGFAHFGVGKIQLGGVVPGHGRAVVAVIDVARFARPVVDPLEDHRRIGVVVVMIFEDDSHALVVTQVFALKLVIGVGRIRQRQEPVGVLDDPFGVDAHVVGNHVRREPDAALPGAPAQVFERLPAAQVFGDIVRVERVGRSDRVMVAHALLDALAGA